MRRGFTLIELLVVISIMSIITLVLLVQQNKFDSSTLLRSLAYSVGLSVRQAQIYGTSVYGVTPSGTTSYASAYGLFFSASSTQSYLLFADTYPSPAGNGQYDAGQDAVAQTFTLGNGYSIAEMYVEGANSQGASTARCSPASFSSLEILFKRPNLDAQFVALTANGNTIVGDSYSSAYVVVKGLDGTTRTISISTTGQIVVGAPNVAAPC
jgi:prepilin-type N-terminal cleavage/methylation domain-containing protein